MTNLAYFITGLILGNIGGAILTIAILAVLASAKYPDNKKGDKK